MQVVKYEGKDVKVWCILTCTFILPEGLFQPSFININHGAWSCIAKFIYDANRRREGDDTYEVTWHVMLFTSVCDSLSSQIININRRACHISSSSSCKTVKGIICDANCRSEESTCGVSWMLCSSSQCAAWARRSKIMREAKTPCRTPWNLVMAIAISDSERQTSCAKRAVTYTSSTPFCPPESYSNSSSYHTDQAE